MALNPTGDDIKAFLDSDDDQPVVMLNLLRFTEGGQDRYGEYMRHTAEAGKPYGIELVYAGTAVATLIAEDGQGWDAVVIARYPSRQHFARMVADPEYQKGLPLRDAALVETVLQPTKPWRAG